MRNKIITVIICFITLIIGINLGSKTTTLNESKKYLSNEELTNIELTQKLEELKTKVSNLEVVNGNTVIDGTITSSINKINNSLANGKIRFGIDSEGNYGYIKDGEDVVNAFNSVKLPDITVKVQVQTTAYVTSSYNGTLVGDTVGSIDPTPFWELGYTKMIIGTKEYTNTTGATTFTYISPRGTNGSSASMASGYISIKFTAD